MNLNSEKHFKNLKYIPFLTLLEKEVRRFWSVKVQTILTPMINSSLYLLIFGVSLGSQINLSSDLSYLAFIIPGLIMMSALNNSFQNASSTIVSSKFHGDIQDYRVVTLTNAQIIWALSFGGLARGLSVALATGIVCEIFYYVQMGEWLPVKHPFMLLYFVVIGGLSFAQLGMSVGFKAKNFEQVNGVGSFVLLPLLYLGGVFYSIDMLHPLWKGISQMNPLLYYINGVRYGVLGVSDVPIEMCFGISVVSLAILYLIALYNVSRGSFGRW